MALILSSTAFAADNKTSTTKTANLAAGSAAAGSSVSFTSTQINTAAKSTQTYIATYKNLPSYIIIGKSKVTPSQFLNLMVQNVININSGKPRSVTLRTFSNTSDATETVKTGAISKTSYVSRAKTIKYYMDSYGKAPRLVDTPLGKIKFQNMVYTFTKILTFQKTYNRLPNYVSVSAWPTSKSFTSLQINYAAKTVMNYVQKYKKLPSYIVISGTNINMPQFLKLMAQNLININSGIKKSVPLTKVNNPSSTITETVVSGKLNKSGYISLANSINSYTKTYGKAPSYLNSSQGRLNFQNLVYTFSKTLTFNLKFGWLLNFISVEKWDQVTTSTYSSRPVYITCDLISSTVADTARNNALAAALQKLGVKATNYGVKGAVWKLLEDTSVPSNALVIEILGGADAAYIKEKGSAWYQNALGNKEIFLVFTDGAKDITGLTWLERAHDDNYSPPSFTGLAYPDKCLLSYGVGYFEPLTTSNYAKCAQAIYAAALDW